MHVRPSSPGPKILVMSHDQRAPVARSRRRGRLHFLAQAFREGLPPAWTLLNVVVVLVGGSVVGLVAVGLGEPLVVVIAVALAVVMTFAEGAYRLERNALDLRAQDQRRLEAATQTAPALSFGRPILPTSSQPIAVNLPEMGGQPKNVGTGRIVRVPVINAQAAGVARAVHARLTFLPDDRHRSFAPRDPAQAEWFGESGPEIEIDMQPNGRPRLLDVLLVLDGEYPNAYEWTTASRHAALRGYAIKSNRIEIEVEVKAAGVGEQPPHLVDRLVVALDRGIITADWASRGSNEATNWVAWT
jgi:hypothetical protein